MNSDPQSPLLPDAQGPAEGEEAGVAKPARKTRAVKPPAIVQASGVAAGPTGDQDPAESAPKPKRRRAAAAVPPDAAPKGGKADIEQGGLPAVSTARPVDATTPAQQPSIAAVVEVGTAESSSIADSMATMAPTEGESVPVADPSVAGASEGEPAGADSAEGGLDGPRSRRRGRRDRNRGERGDSGQSPRADGDAGNAGDAPGPGAAPQRAGELFEQVVSGEFDSGGEPEAESEPVDDEATSSKRVLLPEADAPKLHKVLAQSGIGSRRDMEELIADGHVSVNGEPAHVGQRVSFGDQVKVNGKPVRLRIIAPPARIIAYHKPVGEIVTHDDPQNRPTVFRRLPRLQQGKWQSVGRLDINTEGLLLFTNSGELANQLMHPRFGVEREYAVRLLGTLTDENKTALLSGVDVEGQKASFRSITEGGGDGANHWYRVVITEGRNREVRKLFDTVGLTVSRLIRIRYGTVVLPLGLRRGVWVDLEEGDVRAIRRLASGDGGQREARGGNAGRGGDPRRSDTPARDDRQGARGNDRSRANHRGGDGAAPGAASFGNGADERRDRAQATDGDDDMDFDPASIPNPLEQTFDKRFVQNPRSPAGGRGFRNGGGGFGGGGSAPAPSHPKRGGAGGPKQPDPLQTSLGVFGADAFHRKNRGGGGGGGGAGGGGPGGRGGNKGGGFGGPGGGRRGR